MALTKGTAACSSGLAGELFTQLSGDGTAGFSGTLSPAQEAAVKAICWAVAKTVVEHILAHAQVTDAGGTPTGDLVK